MNRTMRRQAARAGRQRAQPAPPLPKFFRPKIDQPTQTLLQVIHWDLLDRMTHGQASTADLWDWMELGYTYSQMMRMLAEDGTDFEPAAIQTLLDAMADYEALALRLRRTGHVGFTGPELQRARVAAELIDALIPMDRHGIALRAALWSADQMERIRRRAAG